jgi:PadR family transcriptional regulator, regulatory protein PadR
MAKTNAAFMSGVPELLVLRLLSRQEMYGYQLVQAIKVVSGEVFNLAEGVVYPALHSLEARGLLKAKEKLAEGRTRIYYTITVRGKGRLTELTTEWERVAGGINAVLGGQHE